MFAYLSTSDDCIHLEIDNKDKDLLLSAKGDKSVLWNWIVQNLEKEELPKRKEIEGFCIEVEDDEIKALCEGNDTEELWDV